MEKLDTLLIANRGEIAVRLIKTARHLGIRTIAIYTEPDSASQHVAQADESHLLSGDAARAYLDGDQIISIAKSTKAQAIIPGYGFLSENAGFARSVAGAGMVFVGPSPDSIEQFGLKHTARELAIKAGVPVVPGTQGLVSSINNASKAAAELGYPVMLKCTAGGGGMGLQTCGDEVELQKAYETVQSRGETLFKNAGVFLEKYYPAAHHIEVQVFGNGQGQVATLGERECSIQRRHQKVVEECPSPFVAKNHGLRQKLCAAAKSLAESVQYASAGTLEFLVDDQTGDFFFLEMNTRLQVEHGVTEMVYGVDLVELMLRQADAQLAGRRGLTASDLDSLSFTCKEPNGHSIEVRVYAENPVKGFAPSPGLLQKVEWHELPGTRIDTWIRAGITISPNYDPLLAKVLHHAPDRSQAVKELSDVLSHSAICGPPTNLDFLLAILQSPNFKNGNTITQFLSTFEFRPPVIDVLAGGSYTLVEDYPGRPTIGKGFGHGGPMDPVAFQLANALVGNHLGKEGLEITLAGPDLAFLGDAVVALTGAAISATIDGEEFPMWQRVKISAGQRLTIGKTLSNSGCRAYLAVYGGFTNVAEWFGSKATVPMTLVGGYQGRPLRTGDLLRIVDTIPPELETSQPLSIPNVLLPKYTEEWDVQVMHGPYCEGYLTPEDIELWYNTTWEVSHNSARGGIRLIGPRPKWARADGGDGGSHPSNVIEYGYPMGGINFTGDEPVIFPNDCPDFGGFVVPFTIVKADYWKMGQLRAGNKVRFHRVSLGGALENRRQNEAFIQSVVDGLSSGNLEGVKGLVDLVPQTSSTSEPAVIKSLEETTSRPKVSYCQGGEDYLLVDYGDGSFDINHKCRTTALKRKLEASTGPIRFSATGEGIYNTVCIGNSMMIYYNGLAIPQSQLLDYLVSLEDDLGDLSAIMMPNRTFVLPVTFTHQRLTECIERYMANQRPYASYLPDTFKFVAENNGISVEEYRKLWLRADFVCIGVGFFMALPECLPADPRHRLNAPKMNPSRTFTPEGTISWGGSCLAIYPVDSPGGYMMAGMTIPGVDTLGYKKGFSQDKPWMFEDMDVITFEEVTVEEYDRQMALFRSGRYEFNIKETSFDMGAHNKMLKEVEDEAREIRQKQKQYQDKMVDLEKELLAKWDAERKASGVSMDAVQELLDHPDIEPIEAPVNANVWKVLVEEGHVVQKGQVVAILEAMKMEINVMADDRLEGSKIEKVLVAPNDIVHSGNPLLLVRTKGTKP
ncbi:Putative urea carboxylase [Cytospora mali]|uniref:Urea carboxylase n=1 Tax=Cytospora mali TaxID=578113 RepID=A0A194VCW8_CYTMA|nr:Putative urea carboxylase [Valsa mali var. pyri (nom. inval.)]